MKKIMNNIMAGILALVLVLGLSSGTVSNFNASAMENVVTFSVKEAAEAEAAKTAAADAMADLAGYLGGVTLDNKDEVKDKIFEVEDLIAKAQKLDSEAFFGEEWTIKTLETEIAVLEAVEAEAAKTAAADAMADLAGYLGGVTLDNKDEVKDKIFEVEDLIAKAQKLDSEAFFGEEWTIKTLETEIAVLEAVEAEAAKTAAADAVADLAGYLGGVTLDNKDEVKDKIFEVEDLIAKAQKLDSEAVFGEEWTIKTLETEIAVLEAVEAEEAAKKAAADAVAELAGYLDEVTLENKKLVKNKIQEVKDLVAAAQELDSKAVFGEEWTIKTLETEIAVLEAVEAEEAAKKAAADAVAELAGYLDEVTLENKKLVKNKIQEVKDLVAAAQELDSKAVFGEEWTIETLETEIAVLEAVEAEEAAKKAAADAVAELAGYLDEVTLENKKLVKNKIQEVKDLVAAAQELDSKAVFGEEWTIETLETEIAVLEAVEAEEAAKKAAADAIAELAGYLDEVTLENKEVVKDKIQEVKDLVAAAQELDSEAVFGEEWTIETLEAHIASLETEEAAKIAAADAVAELAGYLDEVTLENKQEVKEKIKEVKDLVAAAQELDPDAVFGEEWTIETLETEIAVVEAEEAEEAAKELELAKVAAIEELKAAGITSDFYFKLINKARTIEGVEALKNEILNAMPKEEDIPLTPLEPSTPIEGEEDGDIPLTPLEPSTPVEDEKDEETIPLTPLEPSTEIKAQEKVDDVKDKAPNTGIYTGVMTSVSAITLSAAALFILRKKD